LTLPGKGNGNVKGKNEREREREREMDDSLLEIEIKSVFTLRRNWSVFPFVVAIDDEKEETRER